MAAFRAAYRSKYTRRREVTARATDFDARPQFGETVALS